MPSERDQASENDVDVDIRRVCSLLESIAKKYPEGSPESIAIQDAACAYITVRQSKSLSDAYQSLKNGIGRELTDEMIATLRQRGIAPDSEADE